VHFPEKDMRRTSAVAGSAAFFLLAPGVVAGLVPWWLTGWRVAEPPWPAPLRALGGLLVVAAVAALVHCFSRFGLEGAGTPAPIAPTERLVVGGLYRHVRNPMYLSVLAAIGGQALWLGQRVLLFYGAAVLVAFVSFVRWYEEPTLLEKFGSEYEAYRRAVPGWWPRLRPWDGGGAKR
jgi:protein-S-isoprenylcysteine O-methyltransferase Ste14